MLTKPILLNFLSALLILLFVYTGVSKLLDHRFFVVTLSKSPLVSWAPTTFSYALPVVELGAGALLLFHQRSRAGWYAAFVLMALFTAYIAFMLLTQSKLPCSCGGALTGLTWSEHLLFNVLFTIISFAGLWLSRSQTAQNIELRFKTIV